MYKIRWGIVSAGRIANTFAKDAALVPNATVVAVAARDSESAKSFAATHKIPRSYGGYDDLFADAEIDAVYVATPHTFHLPHSVAAMQAANAVLCEKPLTTNANECRQLITAAAENDVYLMEAMWTWFLPAIRKAKEWVQAGRIGEVQHIKAEFGYPLEFAPDCREYDPELGGGCLLDLGVYPIAFARYFQGQSPTNMHVRSQHAPNGVEDDIVMLFEYDDCFATLAASFRCKLPNRAYVVGRDGYIAIPDFWRARQCSLYRVDERVDTFVDDRQGSGFEFQIEAVSSDLLNARKESEVVTHADSLAFQEDMDRVRALFDS